MFDDEKSEEKVTVTGKDLHTDKTPSDKFSEPDPNWKEEDQADDGVVPNEGHDVPDVPWVQAADLHTGDEPGEPEASEAKMKHTEEGQKAVETGVGQEQIDDMEDLAAHAREVGAIAIQRGPFEVGGPEVAYLKSGVTPEHALSVQEEDHARLRRQGGNGTPDDEKLLDKKGKKGKKHAK